MDANNLLRLHVRGKDYVKQLTINRDLTINNLRATIEYDHKKITALWVNDRQLMDCSYIGDVLNNNDTVIIMEQCAVVTNRSTQTKTYREDSDKGA